MNAERKASLIFCSLTWVVSWMRSRRPQAIESHSVHCTAASTTLCRVAGMRCRASLAQSDCESP